LTKPHKQLVNIFQLISSAGYFGAENVLIQLSAELGKSGVCNPIIGDFESLRNPHLEIIEECRKHKIETNNSRCGGKFDFKTIRELRKFTQQREIDIVHSHGYKANVDSFLANYGLSTSHVATCYNWLEDEARMRFYAALDRFFSAQI
jgi:hypothetical protein